MFLKLSQYDFGIAYKVDNVERCNDLRIIISINIFVDF